MQTIDRVRELQKEIALAIEVAKGLSGSGESMKELSMNTWLDVFELQKEMVSLTIPTSEEGIVARRGAVMAAINGKSVPFAMGYLTSLILSSNVTPDLFRELNLLCRDGRGDE